MRKFTFADAETVSATQLPRREIAKQSDPLPLYDSIAVVGLGYVGLPLAILAKSKGLNVVGIDIDRKKISDLKQGIAPMLNDHEVEQMHRNRIKFSTDPEVLRAARTIIVCVPTPVHDDHTPNLTPLLDASETVGKHLRRNTLVIIESTINPGVCEEYIIPTLERFSGLVADEDFYFAHCPERINPGDERFTVANIPRVIGARTNDSSLAAAAFYRSILETKTIKITTLKEAESVKMVENAFRDINIAYVNELAMSFDRLGIDIHNVIDAASTKPFGFMPHFPGCGVGGHCIPVDPYYLIDYAEKNGFSHTFIKTARQINSDMPGYTIDRLEEALDSTGMDLLGTKVALLGLAYKRGIADCRESPAFVILDELRERGAHVIAYDPYVPEKSDRNTLEETLKDAEAIIIATDHTIFKDLVPEDLKKHGIRVVVDGRNCLLKEAFTSAGITYRGIGR